MGIYICICHIHTGIYTNTYAHAFIQMYMNIHVYTVDSALETPMCMYAYVYYIS